jgi:glycosyltransferase involved in cell wall biosynthesis
VTGERSPLVSIVTPFYNTAEYLAECIESVLAQTFEDFELLLVNNCSTDGSDRIAREYAARDSRIRVIDNPQFVGQVENYNGALRQISPRSAYVKVVQADDWIYPECLARMVDLATANPRVGIVGAYYVQGTRVVGWGLDPAVTTLSGKEASRGSLLGEMAIFGTPSTLLYRADIVRSRNPCYAEGRMHEDSEMVFEVLADWDFGFVHQVLSFVRVTEDSITGRSRAFNWRVLDVHLLVRTFGERFLAPTEYVARLRGAEVDHMQYLGECALFLREQALWEYHAKGLATIGERIRPIRLAPYVGRAALKAIARPGWAKETWELRQHLRREARRTGETASAAYPSPPSPAATEEIRDGGGAGGGPSSSAPGSVASSGRTT